MSADICPGHRLQSMTGSTETPHYCESCKVWYGVPVLITTSITNAPFTSADADAARIDSLAAEVRSLRTALSLAKGEAEAARAQLAEVTAQRDEAREDHSRARAEVARLANQLRLANIDALNEAAEVERLRADRVVTQGKRAEIAAGIFQAACGDDEMDEDDWSVYLAITDDVLASLGITVDGGTQAACPTGRRVTPAVRQSIVDLIAVAKARDSWSNEVADEILRVLGIKVEE